MARRTAAASRANRLPIPALALYPEFERLCPDLVSVDLVAWPTEFRQFADPQTAECTELPPLSKAGLLGVRQIPAQSRISLRVDNGKPNNSMKYIPDQRLLSTTPLHAPRMARTNVSISAIL
jgi:hypothetical protein